MLDKLIFDDIDLSTYGLYVTDAGIYTAPEPDVSLYDIPGRDGSLVVWNGRYRNVTVRYPCVISGVDFDTNFQHIRDVLLTRPYYCELKDGFITDRYRMGLYRSGLAPSDLKTWRNAGVLVLEFDCKPQWFLNSGKTITTFSSAGTLVNPTPYNAKPLLKITGNGTTTVNGVEITTAYTSSTIIGIDCESGLIYHDSVNMAPYVTIDGELPVLAPGNNSIAVSGTTVSITPRWYVL